MKIITEPTVQIIAKPQFIGSPSFEIPDDGDDTTKLGAFAAKVCYDSSGKDGRANELNQERILETAHGSVLEHLNFSLYITGISRALSLESNRHRMLAVSQRSTRYTNEEDAAVVLDPFYAQLYNNPTATYNERMLVDDHIQSLYESIDTYNRQVQSLMEMNPYHLDKHDLRKWARGKARALLPHALETRLVYTGNIRAWRWIIEARSDAFAEDEIRRLANAILMTLRDEAPLYFNDFQQKDMVRGIPVWVPEYRKV